MTWEEIKAKSFWRGGMSLWLRAYIFGVFFAWLGAITIVERRLHGGTWEQAFWAANQRAQATDRTPVAILFEILVGAVPLLWFTFLSQNKRVTEDDKRAVPWMMAGAALGILITACRNILRFV